MGGQGSLFEKPDAEVEMIARKIRERKANEKSTAEVRFWLFF